MVPGHGILAERRVYLLKKAGQTTQSINLTIDKIAGRDEEVRFRLFHCKKDPCQLLFTHLKP